MKNIFTTLLIATFVLTFFSCSDSDSDYTDEMTGKYFSYEYGSSEPYFYRNYKEYFQFVKNGEVHFVHALKSLSTAYTGKYKYNKETKTITFFFDKKVQTAWNLVGGHTDIKSAKIEGNKLNVVWTVYEKDGKVMTGNTGRTFTQYK